MPNIIFDTATQTEATAYTGSGGDKVQFNTGTALTAVVVVTPAAGASPATVSISIGSKTLIFNQAAVGGSDRTVFADGSVLQIGTVGSEVLTGGNLNDALYGDEGNDTLLGNAGADNIFGGLGNDNILGGDGNDGFLQGNMGEDTVNGGEGDDFGFGGQGNDVIDGGNGNDYFQGNIGNDTVTGGNGNDTVIGGQGADLVFGDDGNDVVVGDLGNDSLFGGNGNDVLNDGAGGGGTNVMSGGNGNDTITGGNGGDTVTGDNGDDSISGGDGADNASGGDGMNSGFRSRFRCQRPVDRRFNGLGRCFSPDQVVLAINDPTLGNGVGPQLLEHLLCPISVRPGDLRVLQESLVLRVGFDPVHRHSQEHDATLAVLFVKSHQVRRLSAARHAPKGPGVQDDHLAVQFLGCRAGAVQPAFHPDLRCLPHR